MQNQRPPAAERYERSACPRLRSTCRTCRKILLQAASLAAAPAASHAASHAAAHAASLAASHAAAHAAALAAAHAAALAASLAAAPAASHAAAHAAVLAAASSSFVAFPSACRRATRTAFQLAAAGSRPAARSRFKACSAHQQAMRRSSRSVNTPGRNSTHARSSGGTSSHDATSRGVAEVQPCLRNTPRIRAASHSAHGPHASMRRGVILARSFMLLPPATRPPCGRRSRWLCTTSRYAGRPRRTPRPS